MIWLSRESQPLSEGAPAVLGAPRELSVDRVRPAYQQVADQLRDLILSGKLTAGDRLPAESDLAVNFGVSRSTAREALRVLASRDLIQTKRGTTGGTFVRRVQSQQVSEYLETSLGLMSGGDEISINDLLHARELLEVPSARLAAERREESHMLAFREAVGRELGGQGRATRFRQNKTFHQIVVEASGNQLLVMMTEPIFRVLQAKFLSDDHAPGFWSRVDDDHDQIMTAIEAGDGEAAEAAMAAHLTSLRRAYHG